MSAGEGRDLLGRIWQATGREIPFVFTRRGRPIRSYDSAWRTACWRAGVLGADGRPKVMHDFRRTAVRRMEQAGIPRSLAMRLTGHKTESVFKRYAVVSEGDLDAATAKLGALGHKDVIAPEPEPETENDKSLSDNDARGESRTHMPLPARDFESRVSAIPPLGRT